MGDSEVRFEMKRMFFLALGVCLITSLTSPVAAAGGDVTGKWDLTTSSPRGERTRAAEFKQEGENLTVTMEGRNGEPLEAKGTVKGSAIEWSVTRETSRGEFTLVYKGTVDGDAMKGTVQFGDFGSGEWTAKRAQ